MRKNIDGFFGASRNATAIHRVDIHRNYENETFDALTIIYDVRLQSNQWLHVSDCVISVGGTLTQEVAKELKVSTGANGEHVLHHSSVSNNDVNISYELKDFVVSNRLLVQMKGSTPLNAYSNFAIKGFVYERS